jgi:hypothetical protein
MINVSPSAWGLLPWFTWFIVKSNVLVKLADEDIGVFMNALDALPPPPLVRLRLLAVAAALPFNCRVVKSMVVELAAVAPRTPTAKAALAKHDLKDMCILLSQISGATSACKSDPTDYSRGFEQSSLIAV